jgi:hypothetical protein
MLASFGLFLSEKSNPKTFIDYYDKRILSFCPTVWITIIFLQLPIMGFITSISSEDLLQIIGYFFYPPFWFLQALMV